MALLVGAGVKRLELGRRLVDGDDALAVAEGRAVATCSAHSELEILGVNDRVQLAALGAELNRRVLDSWMRAGVTVVDPVTDRPPSCTRMVTSTFATRTASWR